MALENFIFYRAAQLQVKIYSGAGRFGCTCLDPYLQVSILIYNHFFKGENVEFLRGDLTQTDLCITQRTNLSGGIKNGWLLPTRLKKIKKIDKSVRFML
ncbi:MAG: hypothetical protein MJ053_03665 [Elusimicrobiaceae bacterium]|nr:hypothetical protein [Elusimicrobiaceae bacterium]